MNQNVPCPKCRSNMTLVLDATSWAQHKRSDLIEYAYLQWYVCRNCSLIGSMSRRQDSRMTTNRRDINILGILNNYYGEPGK